MFVNILLISYPISHLAGMSIGLTRLGSANPLGLSGYLGPGYSGYEIFGSLIFNPNPNPAGFGLTHRTIRA